MQPGAALRARRNAGLCGAGGAGERRRGCGGAGGCQGRRGGLLRVRGCLRCLGGICGAGVVFKAKRGDRLLLSSYDEIPDNCKAITIRSLIGRSIYEQYCYINPS